MTKSSAPDDMRGKLRYPLLFLRLAAGLFFLQWAVEKIVLPETTAAIFNHFYGLNISGALARILGGLEVLLALIVLAGFKRRIAYGTAFVLHLASTLSTIPQLVTPYSAGNHLFAAAVPLLAALWLLFRMAEYDDLMSLDVKLSSGD